MALREEGYWDKHYELELKNFEDDGDEGEVWFGKGLSRRIVDWLIDRVSPRLKEEAHTSFIDIGCGNTFLLSTLLEKLKLKFAPEELKNKLKVLGVDYSINSINLGQRIVKKRDLEDLIQLEQCDFLDVDQIKTKLHVDKFDYIIDKGTFDAICLLASSREDELERAKINYMNSLYSIVGAGSIFILASCNHTREELMELFSLNCKMQRGVRLVDKIETPTIQFGGKVGSQVTCLVLEFD